MTRTAIAAFAGLLAAAAAAAPAIADEPHYASSVQLHALVAKMTEGLATAPVPTGPGAVVLAAHRDRTGQVEVHTRLNDELIAQDGHAKILVGGRVEGNRETAPNEWRGGTIVGGQSFDMSPGDVLWIPAGLPHQVVVSPGASFNYLAVKFEARAPAEAH
jgi:mannose-6-phosphate isomerase-like protein (cupin superfamily)